MYAEHLPSIDIHRLVSTSRPTGRLTLRGGLTIRYTHSASRKYVCLGISGRERFIFRLHRGEGHSSHYKVYCLDCGKRFEKLYWSPHAQRADLSMPAACIRCVKATRISSSRSRETVAGYRADLRAGNYQPVIDGINSGDYVAARIAMEKEGVVPDHRRLFTLPSGHKRRWAYLKKNSQE